MTAEAFAYFSDCYNAFSYSGRGMFGKNCLAVKSLEGLLLLIKDIHHPLPIHGWTYDTLGHDVVFYNPNLSTAK